MKAGIVIDVEPNPLERVGADIAVVGFFADERPLRGGAGVADWRLCGWISELLRRECARGEPGERILLPTFDRLRAPRLLALGLGSRASFGTEELATAAGSAVEQVVALESNSALLDLPRPASEPGRVADALLRGIAARSDASLPPLLIRVLASTSRADSLRTALADAARRLGRDCVTVRSGDRRVTRGARRSEPKRTTTQPRH
jgi:hypothetical protein